MIEWRPGFSEVKVHKLLLSGWGWYTDERVPKEGPLLTYEGTWEGDTNGKMSPHKTPSLRVP